MQKYRVSILAIVAGWGVGHIGVMFLRTYRLINQKNLAKNQTGCHLHDQNSMAVVCSESWIVQGKKKVDQVTKFMETESVLEILLIVCSSYIFKYRYL